MILAFASLTEVFAQKATETDKQELLPILNSKYQESVFQRVFNATAEDIGNTSYDASLQIVDDSNSIHQYLIGLKTFGFTSNWQKVAQFKSLNADLQGLIREAETNAHSCRTKEEVSAANEDVYKKLAIKLAEARNLRIASSISNLRGFIPNNQVISESIYHVLMPRNSGTNPQIVVGEIRYDKIDIPNIRVLGCTSAKLAGNFNFADSNHEYRFTHADSQLLMNFNNKEIEKESWDVTYVEDAFAVFHQLANTQLLSTQKKAGTITESYVWPIYNKKGEVELFSGFNAFYSVGSKLTKSQREPAINRFMEKLDTVPQRLRDTLKSLLVQFFEKAKSTDDRRNKVSIREKCVAIVKECGTQETITELYKLLYRPKREFYIPIPDSKKFHQAHPDFFGKGLAQSEKGKNERTFNLTFEPSGQTLTGLLTQDNLKAIMSKDCQEILGQWILEGVFQLPEYTPLKRADLDRVGINAIRLYRTDADDAVHFEFVYKDEPFKECRAEIAEVRSSKMLDDSDSSTTNWL